MTATRRKPMTIHTRSLPTGARLLALEPRYVFDAAMSEQLDMHTEALAPASNSLVEPADVTSDLFAAAHAVFGINRSDADAARAALIAGIEIHNQATRGSEIAFIDDRLADLDLLVRAIPADVRIVLIDGSRDGVAQMVEALRGVEDITGIHILSHGQQGAFALGTATVNADTMATLYRSAFASIGANLSDDADILIYGCDFGGGAAGATAVDLLASLTGADVAASTDLTGAENRGGDWELEQHKGAVESRILSAPNWDHTLAPLVISVSGQPAITGATGTDPNNGGLLSGPAGLTAVWVNAGTIGSTPIDIKATLVSLSNGTASFNTFGDDLSFWINNPNSTAVVKWEIFASGTNQTVYAFGSPNLQITDIDGAGGVPNSREIVRPQLNGLTSYTLDTPTNLVASTSAAGVNVSGTMNQTQNPPLPISMVRFTWQEVSSWTVEYQLTSVALNANFRHDGDGDFTFTAPSTVSLLELDLDANNSTAPGTAYHTTFTRNGSAVPILDVDVAINQHSVLGTELHSATVRLTNAQAGDQLLVNGSTVGGSFTASGAVFNYTITAVGGQIEVKLTGTATPAQYQAALQAITFQNTSSSPSTVDRQIEVFVTNETFSTSSNAALSTIQVVVTNSPPVANPGTVTTGEDVPVVLDLLGNDSDPDNDPLTVTAINGVALTPGVAQTITVPNGTVTVTSSGVITFTPADGFNGTAVIPYTIADQDGATSSSTHSVTVTPNDPPVLIDPLPGVPGTPEIDPSNPNNLLVPATDAVPLTLNLTPFLTDPEGDALTVTPDPTAMPSWLSFDPATNTFTGTPPADNTGPVVIPVTVDDGINPPYAMTLTIQPANPAPVANAGTSTTPYGVPVLVPMLANDTDPDGDALAITAAALSDPNAGTLTLDPLTGQYTFIPASGFTGPAVITYTITDQDGATATAQHTITVGAAPRPVAINDVTPTPYGAPLTSSVASNDSAVPGSTYAALSQPLNGTLQFNPDGTYTYQPNAGFVGTEVFAYQITDPTGQTALAFASIRVTPPALVAVNDTHTVTYQTVLNGNAAANDTFAPGATFIAITAPQHGTLAMNSDGTYVYTPPQGFIGTVMFAYAVTDPTGQTRFASDTITVTPPAGPIAVDDSYTTAYGTTLSGAAGANDTPGVGSTFVAVSQPTHGTLVFNPDGTFRYTPRVGFAGSDTFTYRITDAFGQSATATERITVAAPPLAAVADAYQTLYGAPVNGAVSTGDTFALGSTFTVAAAPTNGTVTMQPDGSFSYVPGAGFQGTDTFTYRVTDPTGQTTTATATITVTPPALIAVDDRITSVFNAPAIGTVAANDSVAPGSSFAVKTPPAVGTVTMQPNGTFRYIPPGTFAGTVSFTYEVTDPTGQTRTATQTIVIEAPRLVAVNDTYTTPYNTPLAGNAAKGDSYAPGSVFSAVTTPANGTLTMNADGTYRYTPFASFSGKDTFVYRITDPTGRTVTATETIMVGAKPAAHRCLTTFGSLKKK